MVCYNNMLIILLFCLWLTLFIVYIFTVQYRQKSTFLRLIKNRLSMGASDSSSTPTNSWSFNISIIVFRWGNWQRKKTAAKNEIKYGECWNKSSCLKYVLQNSFNRKICSIYNFFFYVFSYVYFSILWYNFQMSIYLY